jgi:hypothetical protein
MRVPSLRRLGIIAAGWFASNLLWGLVAPGFGLAFGAVLTALVHIAQPWRSLFFVGMLLVGAGVVLGLVRPLVVAHMPDNLGESPRRRATRESGVDGSAEPAVSPQRPFLAGPPTIKEVEDANARRELHVLRSNVQMLADEIATAYAAAGIALDDGYWWDDAPSKEMWERVRSSLLGARGAHQSYARTRDAYLWLEETTRHCQANEFQGVRLDDDSRSRLGKLKTLMNVAEVGWMNYLNDLKDT